MLKFGVFIRSDQKTGHIIKNCKRFLQEIKSDAKIVSVKKNEAYKGLNVFLNCQLAEKELLKKRYFIESDDLSTIHSITTALLLDDAFPSVEEDFKSAVRKQIHNLSSIQVLDILKIPFSSKEPEIGSGKWIIVLDVPEVIDLEVFKAMGLPNMILKFPPNGSSNKVKFYCRLCQKDGHTQFQCLKKASDIIHSPIPNENTRASSSDSSVHPSIKIPVTSNSPRTEKHTPKPNLPVLPQGAFDSEITIKPKRVKKTDDASLSKRNRVDSDNNNRFTPTTDKHLSPEEIYPNLFAEEPCTSTSSIKTEEDDPEIIFESAPYTFVHHTMPSTISQGPSQPAPRIETKSQIFEGVISEKFRAIIENTPTKVLSISDLEAFFTHVKKKLCPAEFARQYTEDVEGLFDQLNRIKKRYYSLPKDDSKEDSKFLRILSGVIRRYYNGYRPLQTPLYKIPL